MAHQVSLVLRTDSAGNAIWVRGNRSTIEYYGWLNHFDEQDIGRARFPDKTGVYRKYPRRSNLAIGGNSIRICRSPSMQGNPKGMTNRIRLHSSVSIRDLAELAHFAEKDWKWMETPRGKRLTRLEWEAIYAVA